MGRRCRPARRLPKGVGLAESTSAPSGHVGKGNGGKKGFRFYLVDRERIVHLLSWHPVQSDEELAEALRQVQAPGLIPEAQVRLCVIADGAKWIWTHVQALFPSAVQILDYYHCSEHLHQVAAGQFGYSPAHQTEWVETI
jgi:hypothetical protein